MLIRSLFVSENVTNTSALNNNVAEISMDRSLCSVGPQDSVSKLWLRCMTFISTTRTVILEGV